KSHWSVPLGGASKIAEATRRPVRAPTSVTPVRVQLAASLKERTEQIIQQLRQIFGQVLGWEPESMPSDMNLLDSGLDSLRVMELLSGLKQSLNVVLSAAEFFARPTLAGLAA